MAVLDSTSDPLTLDIDHLRHEFEAAVRRGDPAAAATAYADDATLLAPAAELLRGRGAIERFWQTGIEAGVQAVELGVRELRRSGDVAFEVGEYALHVVPESGLPVVDRGRYLVVHRVGSDGRWRRAAEMFSPDRIPAAEPA